MAESEFILQVEATSLAKLHNFAIKLKLPLRYDFSVIKNKLTNCWFLKKKDLLYFQEKQIFKISTFVQPNWVSPRDTLYVRAFSFVFCVAHAYK